MAESLTGFEFLTDEDLAGELLTAASTMRGSNHGDESYMDMMEEAARRLLNFPARVKQIMEWAAPEAAEATATAVKPPTVFLDEHDVAIALSVSTRTLQRWRLEGVGPDYCKMGSLVRYRQEDVRLWADAQRDYDRHRSAPIGAY